MFFDAPFLLIVFLKIGLNSMADVDVCPDRILSIFYRVNVFSPKLSTDILLFKKPSDVLVYENIHWLFKTDNYFATVSDEYIIAPETGPMYILKFPTDFENPCEPAILNVSSEKNPNLPVRGLQCSKNGFLWIALQEGAMPQAKGKLIGK